MTLFSRPRASSAMPKPVEVAIVATELAAAGTATGAAEGEGPAMPTRARFNGMMALAVTIVGWGLNWPLIKFILQDWPPLFARGLAGVVAGTGLLVFASWTRTSIAVPRGSWMPLLRNAGLNVLAWMGLTTLSMTWLRVSEAALLSYTMPIWAMLLSWPLLGTRPGSKDFLATALGFAGVAVLLGLQPHGSALAGLPGVAAALGAAICFAYGTITGHKALPMPPVAMTGWQVLLGSLPMLTYGLVVEGPRIGVLSPAGWASMAYMTALPMAACYLTWFFALKTLSPVTVTSSTLLVPIVGTLSAALLLGEPLGLRECLAILLTLSGVALALRR